MLREGRVSLSTLLFDTMQHTPCGRYTTTFDADYRVRFQIKVDESSYRVDDIHDHDIITASSIQVSVLDTHTIHIPQYCSCHWHFTQDFAARSRLELRVGMQHAFEAETEVNRNTTSKRYRLQNPGSPGILMVYLEYTNNITEADPKRLLDYLLTTEKIVSPVVTELRYDDTRLADEFASMVFPVSHIARAARVNKESNLVSFKMKSNLDPSTIERPPPLPRFDPILRSIHGNLIEAGRADDDSAMGTGLTYYAGGQFEMCFAFV